MFRALRILLLGLLAIILLTVALANRQVVPIMALPENVAALLGGNWQIEIPLFLVIFAAIIAGVFIGFVWEWFREHRIRANASAKSRQVAKLERELAVMRDATSTPKASGDAEILALLDQRKA